MKIDPPLRSFLFCPGNHARRVEKVFVSGADAAILDLEDAVAVAEKPAARAQVLEALARPRSCAGYVRVNALSTPFGREDLLKMPARGVDGILLPKLDSIEELEIADELIAEGEARHGLREGSIRLIPMIETARALARVEKICAAAAEDFPRVRRFTFGAGDLALDLGMTVSPDEAELDYARSRIVVASRAAGLQAPLDTVWFRLKDGEGFRALCAKTRRMGYVGKLCIHPDQVPVVNAVYAPGADEVAFAQKVVDAFKAAEAQGLASIQVEGQFVDYPVVHRAQGILDAAAAYARPSGG